VTIAECNATTKIGYLISARLTTFAQEIPPESQVARDSPGCPVVGDRDLQPLAAGVRAALAHIVRHAHGAIAIDVFERFEASSFNRGRALTASVAHVRRWLALWSSS
jgi:hypothetical protein